MSTVFKTPSDAVDTIKFRPLSFPLGHSPSTAHRELDPDAGQTIFMSSFCLYHSITVPARYDLHNCRLLQRSEKVIVPYALRRAAVNDPSSYAHILM